MSRLTVGQKNSAPIDLYYEDHGTGRPVVLIHGYPLSGAAWEKQIPPLRAAGYRVITYDRRGFGKSSFPGGGYEYDTFAADLDALLTALDLEDASLVGCSMGGGEVARYLGAYGSKRVRQAAFISSVPPYLLRTDDNPEGRPADFFARVKQGLTADRFAFLAEFFLDFYNADVWSGRRISEHAMQNSWNVATSASPTALLQCVDAWETDFRADLAQIDVPALVIHGDADRIFPFRASGVRTHRSVRESRLVVVEEGPHGILWTHPEIVNPELLDFLE